MELRSALRWSPYLTFAAIAAIHLLLAAWTLESLVAPFVPIVVFYGVGASIRGAWRAGRHLTLDPFGSARAFLADALLSSILFASVSTALCLMWLLTPFNLSLVVDGLTLGGVGVVLWKRAVPPQPQLGTPQRTAAVVFLAMVGMSTILFAYWRQATAFPIVPGWDMHAALVPIHFTIAHEGFAYLLIPPFPAGSEISYPAMFFDLVSGLSVYLGWDPLLVFWWAPWFLLMAFEGTVYLIALRLSSRPVLAVLVAFLGTVLSAMEPEIVRSPFFLQTETVALVYVLLTLAWFSYAEPPNRYRATFSLAASMFLAAFYFYAVVAVFPFLIVMSLGLLPSRWPRASFRIFATLWVAVLAGLAGLSLLGSVGTEGILQFVNPGAFPIALKITLIETIYLPAAIVPLGFAVLSSIAVRKTPDWEPLSGSYYTLASAALFVAYLLPVWVTYRFELYLRYFLVLTIAAAPWRFPGLGRLLTIRSYSERRLGPGESRITHLLPVVLVVLVFLVPALPAVPVVQANATAPYSVYSTSEYTVALWVASHVPESAYLATDPGSGYVFRSLASRNASTSFILSDGRAPVLGDSVVPGITHMLWVAFNTTYVQHNATTAASVLASLGIPDMYLLITTRTYYWASHDADSLLLTAPIKNQDPAGFSLLFESPDFTPVYHAGDVYLLQFNPS